MGMALSIASANAHNTHSHSLHFKNPFLLDTTISTTMKSRYRENIG
jgi:hypothetical protein